MGTPQYTKPIIESIKADGVPKALTKPSLALHRGFIPMVFRKIKKFDLVLPWNSINVGWFRWQHFYEDRQEYRQKKNVENDKKKKKENRTIWGRINFLLFYAERCHIQKVHLIHMKSY